MSGLALSNSFDQSGFVSSNVKRYVLKFCFQKTKKIAFVKVSLHFPLIYDTDQQKLINIQIKKTNINSEKIEKVFSTQMFTPEL